MPSYLDIIPNGIWQNCWVQSPQSDLKQLALVCHTFHHTCLPVLFETIVHVVPSSAIQSALSGKAAVEYDSYLRLKSLANSPSHASAVRNISFSRNTTVSPLTGATDEVDQIELGRRFEWVELIPSFTNIQQIALLSVNLTQRILESLKPLQNLRNIILTNALIKCPRIDQPFKLREFRITNEPEFWSMFRANPTKADRLISGEKLRVLEIHCGLLSMPLLTSFTQQGIVCRHLTVFHAVLDAATPITTIIDFLALCPALEELYIPTSDSREIPISRSSLSLDIVPHLARYLGPFSIAEALVPGRPLKELHITTFGAYQNSKKKYIKTLASGSCPLETLIMEKPVDQEMFVLIAGDLPKLTCLIIYSASFSALCPIDLDSSPTFSESLPLPRHKNILTKLANKRLPLPVKIQILNVVPRFSLKQGDPPQQNTQDVQSGWSGVYDLMPIEEQKLILSSLSDFYPSLTKVDFGMQLEWTRTNVESEWISTVTEYSE